MCEGYGFSVGYMMSSEIFLISAGIPQHYRDAKLTENPYPLADGVLTCELYTVMELEVVI